MMICGSFCCKKKPNGLAKITSKMNLTYYKQVFSTLCSDQMDFTKLFNRC